MAEMGAMATEMANRAANRSPQSSTPTEMWSTAVLAALATRDPLDLQDLPETMARMAKTEMPVWMAERAKTERSSNRTAHRQSLASSAHLDPPVLWDQWDPRDRMDRRDQTALREPTERKENRAWPDQP